jgi:two-component system, sensor histidine kinase RpfC
MGNFFQSYRKVFANRLDSEHQQGIVRLAITFTFTAYLLGVVSFNDHIPMHLWSVLLVLSVEGLVGIALLIAIAINPGASNTRRWIGMLLDYSMMAATMYFLGEVASPMYVVFLWVTIGNGLRYGRNFLLAAIANASLSFTIVILTTPFWKAHSIMSWGLLIGLIALPLYLASLLTALTDAVNEARRANAAKSRFLASMSHELRSPLNGIIGMAELLSAMRLNAEQRECADVIQTSAHTLSMLVEDVLDISAIEAGKLKRQDSDLNLRELVRRLRTMLLPLAAAKGLKFSVILPDTLPSLVRGDSGHLLQVLMNLMHNAIKFTEYGGVQLQIVELTRINDVIELRFSIRDTGIGIPEVQREKIFQAFEQIDSGPTRRYGGTGLGTTIAKTLTELMGGDIGFERNTGGGSHFWVELEFALINADPHAFDVESLNGKPEKVVAFDDPFVRHRARIKPLNILVADDIAANRLVLQRLLERAGHRVVLVMDGEEALDHLAETSFDIAFVDLHMPGISGLDVIRQARVMQAGMKPTPLVALSADATTESIEEAESAGANMFLSKPVVTAKLLDAIVDLMKTDVRLMAKPPAAVMPSSKRDFRPEVIRELASMNLGDEFLQNFVTQSFQDFQRCLLEFEQAGACTDFDQLRESAHAMKGVSENLGVDSLSETCTKVMHASSVELSRDWRKYLKIMTNGVQLATEQIRVELKTLLSRHEQRSINPKDD